MSDASTVHPVYTKVQHEDEATNDGLDNGGPPHTRATPTFFITCDEGWRQSIVCERMYGWAADWLIGIIQGRPYASKERALSPKDTPPGQTEVWTMDCSTEIQMHSSNAAPSRTPNFSPKGDQP